MRTLISIGLLAAALVPAPASAVTVDNISIGNFLATQAHLTIQTTSRAGDRLDEAWSYQFSDTGYCFIGLGAADDPRPAWRACLSLSEAAAPSGLFECWPSEIMTADSTREDTSCPQLEALADALAEAVAEVAGCDDSETESGGQEGEDAACGVVDSLDWMIEVMP